MSDSKGIRFECVEDKSVHHIDTGEYTIGRGWLNVSSQTVVTVCLFQNLLKFFVNAVQ